ncbi:MAG: response regulator transcription factor [Ancrocorticia sp.]|jgi:DNA-binding NarL/FixJ family response regulator|nr:response regulator transcription factor [Ancrocorticia sp.]MCI2002990.1 response regulator transcription factor [Ancrocorticia sp.]
MTTVLVADDQALIRQAVTEILSTHPCISVVGEARDGVEAISETRSKHPDVVLMDIRMPGMDGIEATAQICADPALAETHVLVLTTFEEDDYVVSALKAGASGFIGKGAEPDDIIRAVLSVDAGDALLSPNATRSLIQRYIVRENADNGVYAVPLAHRDWGPGARELTDREREVLVLVARGYSNAEIADLLVISPHTAKTHVNRIMMKLDAHDRAQLVIFAYESGLLAPGM